MRTARSGGAASGAVAARTERWIALIGNPNTGKTTVFNALTGGWARTGNYPGVTVDRIVGTLRHAGEAPVRVLDLPGTYSLSARSPDEMLAVDVLLGRLDDTPRPGAVVVVVDATNVERNLYLVTQVMELGLPTVIALNMVDTASRRGIEVDAAALSERLGIAVVPTVAHRGEGIRALVAAAVAALDGTPPAPPWSWPDAFLRAERDVARVLDELGLRDVTPVERRRALLDVDGEAEHRLVRRGGPRVGAALAGARAALDREGPPTAGLESSVRYAFIGTLAAACVRQGPRRALSTSDRIDAVLTHRVLGTAVLVVVMSTMFLSIFAWAAPLMDLVDSTVFGSLADAAGRWELLGDGALKSLVVEGVIAGVGSVLVFLPQILVLFGLIALLEGCGYMSRAAFMMDRLMQWCGLSGRSFIPMLSSFACAVPGILSTRTIPNRRDRVVTILVAPFMSCSARIPVYALLIAAFVPPTMLLGFLPLQGLVFTAMYFVGIFVAIPTAWVLKRTLFRSERPSFLVELPPYRVPHLPTVGRRMYEQGKEFMLRAGTLIFAATILVWALSYFPRHPEPGVEAARAVERHEVEMGRALEDLEVERARQEQTVAAARAQSAFLGEKAREGYEAYLEHMEAERRALAAKHQALVRAAESAAAGEALRYSYLGRAGRFVEPVFEPVGWDWKVSVAVLAAFPAREVLVSSLGVIYDLGGGVDEETEGLRQRLRSARWESGPRAGERVFDLAGAIALMVFFALCAQCTSTLVTIRKETGGWGWAAFSFGYMTLLAYVGALVTALVLRGIL